MLNVSHIDYSMYQIMKLTPASKRKQKWGGFSFFNFGCRKNFVVFFLVEEYFFSLSLKWQTETLKSKEK